MIVEEQGMGFLRSLFPMDQRGVLLMDKTWRSRVFGQGRTRSGGPRLCADWSEEFDSLLWGMWIHGELEVKAEIRHEEVQKG